MGGVRKEDACHVTYTKSTTSRGFVGTCVPMPRLRTLRNPSSTPRPHPLYPDTRSRRGLSSSTFANRSITSYASPPFAFASRASVSLGTPKHIFRSFGILSVAAVVPTSTSPSNRSISTRRQNGDTIATRADKESGAASSTSSIFDSLVVHRRVWNVVLDFQSRRTLEGCGTPCER